MLGTCGVDSLDGLYADVPDGLRLARHYSLPDEMSEKEVRDFFDALGRKNRVMTCFAGAGYYHHYAPSLTRAKLSLMLCRYTCVNPPLTSPSRQFSGGTHSASPTLRYASALSCVP